MPMAAVNPVAPQPPWLLARDLSAFPPRPAHRVTDGDDPVRRALRTDPAAVNQPGEDALLQEPIEVGARFA